MVIRVPSNADFYWKFICLFVENLLKIIILGKNEALKSYTWTNKLKSYFQKNKKSGDAKQSLFVA